MRAYRYFLKMKLSLTPNRPSDHDIDTIMQYGGEEGAYMRFICIVLRQP